MLLEIPEFKEIVERNIALMGLLYPDRLVSERLEQEHLYKTQGHHVVALMRAHIGMAAIGHTADQPAVFLQNTKGFTSPALRYFRQLDFRFAWYPNEWPGVFAKFTRLVERRAKMRNVLGEQWLKGKV
jgi:hypothetical protein